MHIRLGKSEPGSILNIEHENGLQGAEENGLYGIKKETIGGVEYYTRTFAASSATSTFKNEYFIDLSALNAPEGTIFTPYGRLVVNKTDDIGHPLSGAIFKLTGADGSSFDGTSNSNGQIIWENLLPDVQYTLTETQAPEGYLKAEPMTISVPAGQTQTVTVKDVSERYFRIRTGDVVQAEFQLYMLLILKRI